MTPAIGLSTSGTRLQMYVDSPSPILSPGAVKGFELYDVIEDVLFWAYAGSSDQLLLRVDASDCPLLSAKQIKIREKY